MADKTDDLVIGVSTDLSSVQRAIKKLDGDIARAGSQIEKRFAAVGKSIDKALPTGMQDRINKMVGVQVAATKEWTGALANQSKEMDRLRAKFSPMFSTISNYKTAVNEIRAAHRLGAISADEMATAIQRERQAALSSIAAIKGRNAALADTPAFRGGNNFNTANIAAQLQDIGVMAQMGIASPLTIALQQGTQLAAVFNQMGGTRDVIRGIGAAFLSIVNPISLVTIGTIAAGVAAYNYFAESKEGSEATEKALKEQAELIQRIAQKWGDALPAVRAYADEQDRLAGRADATEAYEKLAAETFKAIGQEVSSAGDAIRDVMGLLQQSVPTEQIVAVNQTLATLSQTASENKTTVDDMNAAHKALMDAFRSSNIPILKETADAIAGLTPKLAETNAEMQNLASEKELNLMLEDLQAKIGSIDSAKAREELRTLMDQTKKGEISVKDLLAELSKISGYAPDVSTIISAFRSVAEAAAAARQASAGIVGKESQGGRVRYGGSGYMQLPDSVGTTPTSRPLIEFEALPKSGGGRRSQAQRDADAYRDLVKTAKDRIDQMKLEAELVGKTGAAADAYRMKLELLQQATDKGRKISPEQRAELEKLADTYGKVTEKVAALKLQEDLLFERQQMFRSPTEQRIFSQLRSSGIDPASATGEFLASQIRLNEQLALGADLAKDFASGFVDDLLNGVSAMDALANAAARLGQKLLDMAMDQAINALFGNLVGALGGGIGGGIGGGSWAAANAGFATGTANTGGRRGEPRGVVHGQEAVIPLPHGGKVPVQIQAPVAPKFAAADVAGTINAPVNINIDASGADPAAIARLETGLAKVKNEIPGQVIASVRKAQKSNVKLG